ncbi:hypothetical protein [Kitasatospora phosalacinea]|uniref:Uncharacterized protein n=1 Tax=Kitasatospora phosalacinea TaxID=2065 RepID=A0A9W6PKC9_9ACTN|nr:hypothetical protein Kpho01_46160 [Kitasatospora phosalacinea]
MHHSPEPPYQDGQPASGDGQDGAADSEVTLLYALVAERLKQAHARVHALNVSTDAKTALTRQLLIVTETAKRDLPGAARRLSRFVQDLDEGRMPPR